MKLTRLLSISALAFLFGCASGILGTIIEHRNEAQFGAAYPRFRGEWLAIPAFPGFAIAELRHGFTWQVGEPWGSRWQIRLWNGVFWSAISLLVAVPIAIRRHFRTREKAAVSGATDRISGPPETPFGKGAAGEGGRPVSRVKRRVWGSVIGLVIWGGTLRIHIFDYKPGPGEKSASFHLYDLYNWLPAVLHEPSQLKAEPTALLAAVVFAIPGFAYLAACYLVARGAIFALGRFCPTASGRREADR